MSTDQVTNFDVKVLLLKKSYQHLIGKNNPNPFRPGMSASVDIQTNSKSNILTIPIQTVTTRADSTEKEGKMVEVDEKIVELVFVVSGDSARTREVITGIQDNKYIEIKEGLTAEDQVITAPYSAISRKLKDGSIIKVVKKEELFKEKD
jgi:HlyD family secretion protein